MCVYTCGYVAVYVSLTLFALHTEHSAASPLAIQQRSRDGRGRDGRRERGISKHTHTNSPIAWLAAMTDGGVQLTGVAMETSISGSLSFSTLSGNGELHTLCRGVQRGQQKPFACCL